MYIPYNTNKYKWMNKLLWMNKHKMNDNEQEDLQMNKKN